MHSASFERWITTSRAKRKWCDFRTRTLAYTRRFSSTCRAITRKGISTTATRRTKAGVALECLPTKEGVLVGIMLVKPEDEEICVKLSNKELLKQFFNEQSRRSRLDSRRRHRHNGG